MTVRRIGRIFLKIGAALIVIIVALVGFSYYNANKYDVPGPDPRDPSVAMAEGNVDRVEGEYLNGFYYHAKGVPHPGTVVVFGGSEGGAAHSDAVMLREQGYNVLALYFFGQPNQQQLLDEVPLDFFNEVLDWIRANDDSDAPLTVIGSSKGAELTANLAARYPEIDNIVLYTPGEYTYQSLSFDKGEPTSSFTYEGRPVDFLAFKGSFIDFLPKIVRFLLNLPISYRGDYEKAIAEADNADAARIDLSKFAGHGLLFAGEQDRMWPGEQAARNLAEQNPQLEAVVFEGAGHVFLEDMDELGPVWPTMLGGTLEGNKKAKIESDKLLFERLEQWHSVPAN
ncbi:putative hydrolase or acyltransferase of alpha/beta superfamily [Corynebacterium mustelae]|uniref:Putative hydrolase or acyltransferase of alpha/beta superfamily n=1 Tax=Corynebacterium mustelae TaxID=571915 RepID=A0A0G3GUQ0_9CORY|nr:acyl-CoA thioester hydrolase/BAAT C-terminal domain-containing protein [Corynebacterium mustelae]AKK04879.1 putative hydrolase or acyltransferase of alpha/beta superfamily [Corynebacterium mustelae]